MPSMTAIVTATTRPNINTYNVAVFKPTCVEGVSAAVGDIAGVGSWVGCGVKEFEGVTSGVAEGGALGDGDEDAEGSGITIVCVSLQLLSPVCVKTFCSSSRQQTGS